jgi:hypothetical protein
MKTITEYGPCETCGGCGKIWRDTGTSAGNAERPCPCCVGGRVKVRETREGESGVWRCSGCGGLAPCVCGKPPQFVMEPVYFYRATTA